MRPIFLESSFPYGYLKDIFTRYPIHKSSRIGELLPYRLQSENTSD